MRTPGADASLAGDARPELAAEGRLAELAPDARRALLRRGRAGDPDVAARVAEIIAAVRSGGDAALRALAERFDGVTLDALEVPGRAMARARDGLDRDVRAALELAAGRIETFHRALVPAPLTVDAGPGVTLGRRFEPLERAGAYAPGGRAAYASSVLMCALPARAAGVGEVVLCSPPGADGRPSPEVLAAAAIARVDRVFALGGAGAVAALALGTDTVPAADCVVGPGNAYVAEAKRQVAGLVVTDAPAGPSEILVIADGSADPASVAAELLAQAEHDPDAAALLVSTDDALAAAVRAELGRLVAEQPRGDVVRESLAGGGAVLLADSLDEALSFASAYAPEHLSLMIREPRAALERVRNAGTVFLGAASSVVFGDYVSGANHTLPTGGLARSMGGLSTGTFLRGCTWQELSPAGAAGLADAAATLAEAEGLPGHAAAARLRAGERGAEAIGRVAELARARAPGRAAYRELSAYDPGREPVALDLSDNTSRFGSAPAAARAFAGLGADVTSRYPAVYADSLRIALAAYHGVEPENVTTGCGSDDVLDSALRAFCDPGATLVYPDPTFGMVPVLARMNALRAVGVPSPVADPDVDRLLAAAPAAVYLCRPNNPTGLSMAAAAVRRADAEARGAVLLDEAYADFAGEDLTAWAAASERTVSLRTFSKAWGLAGGRVGYAIGPAAAIAEIEKSRGPYKVSAPAEAAALAALAEDDGWRAEAVARAIEARAALSAALVDLGFDALASRANFVLAPVADAPAAKTALYARGVGVRAFAGLPGVGDAIRVTVGPPEAMDTATRAIEAALAAGELTPAPPEASP
ncbi:MAG: histidinol dehydrogenase [Gemmatimonadota bacterium]